MSTTRKIREKFAEFRRAERKAYWLWDQGRWRYFTYRHRKEALLNSVFDREHAIETAVEIPLGAVGVPQADVARGNAVYRPLTETVFRAALASVHFDPAKFTFVDIGSGKGKVMFMAADHAFRRIVGIEYAAGLHEVALRNIASYRSKTQICKAIEAVHADVLEYTLPEGPLLLFIFNALAKQTMRGFLEKVDREAARDPKRPIALIYTNVRTVAEIGNVFSALPNLRIIRRERKYVVIANEAAAALAQ